MNQGLEILSRAMTSPSATAFAALVLYALVAAIKRIPYVSQIATSTPLRTRATAFVLACAPAALTLLATDAKPSAAAITAFVTFVASTGLDKLLGQLPNVPPVAGLLMLCGCGSTIPKALESARDVITVSEPCLALEHDADVQRCNSVPKCLETVKAFWAPIANALDLFHVAWCEVSPKSEGCQ